MKNPANSWIYQMGSLLAIGGIAGLMLAVLSIVILKGETGLVFALICGGPGLLALAGGIFIRAIAEVRHGSRRSQVVFLVVVSAGFFVVLCTLALMLPGLMQIF